MSLRTRAPYCSAGRATCSGRPVSTSGHTARTRIVFPPVFQATASANDAACLQLSTRQKQRYPPGPAATAQLTAICYGERRTVSRRLDTLRHRRRRQPRSKPPTLTIRAPWARGGLYYQNLQVAEARYPCYRTGGQLHRPSHEGRSRALGCQQCGRHGRIASLRRSPRALSVSRTALWRGS